MDAGRFTASARRWWWLCVLGALFALASYGVALRLRGDDSTTLFHTTATVFVSAQSDESAAASVAPSDSSGLAMLAASYAKIIEGRLVSERLAVYLKRGAEAQSLRERIDARVVAGTQIIEVTSTGVSPEEADLLASGASNAFVALHAERELPGSVMLYEVSPSVADAGAGGSPWLMGALVALAGVAVAVMTIALYERFGERMRAAAAAYGSGAGATGETPVPTPRKRRPPERAPKPAPIPQINLDAAATDTESMT